MKDKDLQEIKEKVEDIMKAVNYVNAELTILVLKLRRIENGADSD